MDMTPEKYIEMCYLDAIKQAKELEKKWRLRKGIINIIERPKENVPE